MEYNVWFWMVILVIMWEGGGIRKEVRRFMRRGLDGDDEVVVRIGLVGIVIRGFNFYRCGSGVL